MSTYVLVHGAWHGPWCWSRLAPILLAGGHAVDVVELPGRGEDLTPPGGLRLDAYAARVHAHLRKLNEPAILVGHSFGGMAITQAAGLDPARVGVLVYVCAFLPRDGESLRQLTATNFETSIARRHSEIDLEASISTIAEEGRREAFYGLCDEATARQASAQLVPESLGPGADPVSVSAERVGRIPSVYIEALQDKTVPLAKQREMHQAAGVERVLTIDSDHSPFLSRPNELASLLMGATVRDALSSVSHP